MLCLRMVRLMMVRHAQSVQNEFMEMVIERVRQGELPLSEFNKTMRNGPPEANAGQDATLTSRGVVQAERLGKEWGPILTNVAKLNRLIVFVSPFLRCCLTADPVMKYITERVSSFKATILPMIMEEGGLCDAQDMKILDEVTELIKAGNSEAGIKLLKSAKWQRMGMTGKEISNRFPWSRRPSELGKRGRHWLTSDVASFCLPIVDHQQWYANGWEGKKAIEKRMRALMVWVKSLQYQESDDVTVLWFTHGGTISNMSNRIMTHGVNWTEQNVVGKSSDSIATDGIYNTSVTSFLLPSPSYVYPWEMRNNSDSSQVAPWRVKLEFFNDTAHLGIERLNRFGELFLSAKL